MTDSCVVCVRNTDSKTKPGIFPCLGCKQMFCTQHVAFHRQELANEFDLIIGERNELQDVLDHPQNLLNVSVQINLIDEWVKKTIEQVYQVADNARERVIRLVEEQKMSITGQFTQMSKQFDTFRENETFYEKDIEDLKEKCIHLKRRLNPVDINVIITDISSSLTQAVTLQQTVKKPVETLSFVESLVKDQKPYKTIKTPYYGLVHIGNGVALIRNSNGCTMIDLNTDSLQSICMNNTWRLFCWSTHLSGFLCTDADSISKIIFFNITRLNLRQTHKTYPDTKNISCMVCFSNRMMLVCCGTTA